jgi:hypothetical protein
MAMRNSIVTVVSALALAVVAAAPQAGAGGAGLKEISGLVLQQPVEVEIGYARAFIQNGRVVDNRELDRYRTYCDLEVREVARAGRSPIVIQPGRFQVVRLNRSHIPFGAVYSNSLLRDAPGPIDLKVKMGLSSSEQPGVLRLNCTRWSSDPFYHGHPDAVEIQTVLGDIATLDATAR